MVEWVKTADRLPDFNKPVLLYEIGCGPNIGHLSDDFATKRAEFDALGALGVRAPDGPRWVMNYEDGYRNLDSISHWSYINPPNERSKPNNPPPPPDTDGLMKGI